MCKNVTSLSTSKDRGSGVALLSAMNMTGGDICYTYIYIYKNKWILVHILLLSALPHYFHCGLKIKENMKKVSSYLFLKVSSWIHRKNMKLYLC